MKRHPIEGWGHFKPFLSGTALTRHPHGPKVGPGETVPVGPKHTVENTLRIEKDKADAELFAADAAQPRAARAEAEAQAEAAEDFMRLTPASATPAASPECCCTPTRPCRSARSGTT
ncbi:MULTISPECIES: hypothetical protein [unclassified Streptomyces]|uniref:hypothetical protein n=1 Tax=unclassified Streptomyces TaxID=2593676 RepID=UPI0036EBF5F6